MLSHLQLKKIITISQLILKIVEGKNINVRGNKRGGMVKEERKRVCWEDGREGEIKVESTKRKKGTIAEKGGIHEWYK